MTVTVVGGGIVGLCCAHYLSEAGHEVTVLERARVGSGASRGNAGEICPDLVVPLPAPGTIVPALRGLPRPESALYIRPRPDPALLRFLVRFAVNTTERRYARGVRTLAKLADGTFDLFAGLAKSGVDGDTVKHGFVFAFSSRAAAMTEWEAQRKIGAPLATDVLGARGLRGLEPALGDGARAGFLVGDQWSVDPSRFVDRLVSHLRAKGVRIVEGARATFVEETAGGARVRSSAGDFGSETVVIAAGVRSRELCRQLGAGLNLFPGKGYSFSVEADPLPRQVVHLGDARVVFTPMGGRLRVAGTMEFDSDPDAFHARRIAAIVAAARPYLAADWDGRRDEWVGARVLTPDGLPAIGRVPGRERILLASGHNMLGLMLGPATGRLITDFVAGEPDPALVSALDPDRLARRVRPR
ncbi:NAD(P)/FAD-dependent oxidoreductase [Amycolatopsis minnesotensis]|uniref:FAD-dependent oxidoreductase n=1 Tax=Amycolatopsis minnesotensis TaxID=337894 RepID=A0ABN2RM71_9PSEU